MQRVVAEEPDVQSVICVDGGMQPLPISGRYHDFVRKGSGLIQRDFGEPAYRMDVSERIDQGNSWQLPVYLAHYLSAEGMLGDGEPQPGDKVLWSTGALKADRSVLPVEEVFNKLTLSAELFGKLKDNQVPCLVLVPAQDESALVRWQESVEGPPDGLQTSVADLDGAVRLLKDFLELKDSSPMQPAPVDNAGGTEPSLLREPYLPPPGMLSESVPALGPERETECHSPLTTGNASQTYKKAWSAWPWAGLAVLMLAGGGVAGWSWMQASMPPPRLVIEVAQAPGDCGRQNVLEQALLPMDGVFPEVGLNRLCALWMEVPPEVSTVVGVSLDNGALVPVNFNIDRWRISLPNQRFRDREYALLVAKETLLDANLSALSSELGRHPWDAEHLTAAGLLELAKKQGIDAEVYTQKLIYRKMSYRDF
ncbi:MAG: hypothetical protein CMK89_14650 [Pseudomonadales bacterium]|nr:hypothetical protein [Pseudomonadales bacterium]